MKLASLLLILGTACAPGIASASSGSVAAIADRLRRDGLIR